MKKTLLALFFLTPFVIRAQESYWIKTDSLFKYIQPVASLQLWSTYTTNDRAQLQANGGLERVQDRVSFMARRARFGFKGKPYKKLSYVLTVQYDNLGNDKFSGIRGSTNTGTLGILDAYVTWQLTRNELVYVTTGYFHPQFSRECITGDLLVNSFDKSPTQGYIRQHIDGKSYGRATGLNLGGIKPMGIVQIGYNVGVFSNNSTAADTKTFPETTGRYWSPLTVERITVSFGDPDMKTYAINYDANNYFSKRKGVTLGFNVSQQGKSEIFTWNHAEGVDVLFNYGHLNLDGEWNWLERKIEGRHFQAQAGHIRLGYNIIVAKKAFIEPTFAVVMYDGDNGGQFTGKDHLYDIGVNWYLNKKNCKLALHYIKQEGHGNNSYTDDTTFKKGDFVGLAFVLII
jgi:hypothetical protein